MKYPQSTWPRHRRALSAQNAFPCLVRTFSICVPYIGMWKKSTRVQWPQLLNEGLWYLPMTKEREIFYECWWAFSAKLNEKENTQLFHAEVCFPSLESILWGAEGGGRKRAREIHKNSAGWNPFFQKWRKLFLLHNATVFQMLWVPEHSTEDGSHSVLSSLFQGLGRAAVTMGSALAAAVPWS